MEIDMLVKTAKYGIGQIVQHRLFSFRGVIIDIDPVFANSEEWYNSIPEDMRPDRNQPFYHLLAENDETHYLAYVSEQNLMPDESGIPIEHPQIQEYFREFNPKIGKYSLVGGLRN